MSKKNKILLLFITEDWYFWSHRLKLACSTREAGYEVYIATRISKYEKEIKDRGLHVIPLKYLKRRRINPFLELLSIIEIVNIYRSIKPSIVHHVALKPVLYGSIAARITKVPNIINAFAGLGHSFIGHGIKAVLFKKILKGIFFLILKKSNSMIIFQNSEDLNIFVKSGIIKHEQAKLIKGAGVDINKFFVSPEAPGKPVIAITSRMLWTKGINELVAATLILKSKNVECKTLLVGINDPENPASIPDKVLEKFQEEGDEVIEYCGYNDNIPKLLSNIHIFCLPTFYGEGVPLSLIEAAASGKPIVTTDVPGCRDIVRHGLNGFLVSPKEVKPLADALQKLIENPKLRKKMGLAGRKLVEQEFSDEIIIKKTLDLYKRLLS
ncbi:glycosyltransferase family 4 protein [Candidatus Latescibacterota bacterium]